MDSSQSGQMNLLEEILDSLNTTTLDNGKLSAAKSLDFFRSMDDLDYKAPVRNKQRLYLDNNCSCKRHGINFRRVWMVA